MTSWSSKKAPSFPSKRKNATYSGQISTLPKPDLRGVFLLGIPFTNPPLKVTNRREKGRYNFLQEADPAPQYWDDRHVPSKLHQHLHKQPRHPWSLQPRRISFFCKRNGPPQKTGQHIRPEKTKLSIDQVILVVDQNPGYLL